MQSIIKKSWCVISCDFNQSVTYIIKCWCASLTPWCKPSIALTSIQLSTLYKCQVKYMSVPMLKFLSVTNLITLGRARPVPMFKFPFVTNVITLGGARRSHCLRACQIWIRSLVRETVILMVCTRKEGGGGEGRGYIDTWQNCNQIYDFFIYSVNNVPMFCPFFSV